MGGLTIDNPVTLAAALASSRILPGDVLELADGAYTGDYESVLAVAGTEAAPVIIKPRNPGLVTIDGSLKINGAHVHLYDLNFTDNRTDRTLATNSITCNSAGFHIHGCIISDVHNSGINWFGSGIGEISENIIRNCGIIWPSDFSEHGHSIYTHNHNGGARLIARNAFGENFGNYGLQIYSGGDNYLKDYTVEDNVTYGTSVTTGGGLGLIDFIYRRNIQYQHWCQQGIYSYDNQNQNGLIDSNIFIGLGSYSVNQYTIPEWLNLTEQNNIVWGGEPSSRIGYTAEAAPDTYSKFTVFSKSARWAGLLVIYNKLSAENVSCDLTGLAAGDYVMRNTINPSETWAFTYVSGSVSVPTAWTSAARIGAGPTGNSWPIFGSLVIETA